MSDLIPVIAVISLCANAVLMIAYGSLYRSAVRMQSDAAWLRVELDRMSRNSVRRDPKTGRYLKNRSN